MLIKTIYCRIFQFFLKIGNYFLGYKTPILNNSLGSTKTIYQILNKENKHKPLIVSDNVIKSLNLMESLIDSLKENSIEYTLYTDVSPNPTIENVENGYKLYRENNCDSLIAFGGGSPIDCAKAIGAKVVNSNKSISKLQGLLKVKKTIPLLIAVPTTAGTGSETTVAAVITNQNTHLKKSINDPHIMPKYAFLDPSLTVGLPKFTTAITGLDALTHAIEAYLNHTYNTKYENKLALDAIKLIHDNIETAYNDGKNIVARENMLLAAFYAGRAFTRGCVGYVHAIGHTLSGLYNVPHGEAMSIILPHVLRMYGKKIYKRLSKIADVCSINGNSKKEKSENFIKYIEDLKVKFSIKEKIDVIKDSDINKIVDWADKECNPLYPVPKILSKKELKKFILKISEN